jgi:hypothetical protein
MAFFLGAAESVLSMAEGEVANIASTAIPYLEKKIKNTATSFVAKEVGQYASNNPGGIVDMTLQKTYQNMNHKRNNPRKHGRKKRRV